MPSIQSSWWLFTLNSKESVQEKEILPVDLPSFDSLVNHFEVIDLRFCQYSHEFESRHHLQGVFQFSEKVTLKGVKKAVPEPWCNYIHCEPLKLLKNDSRKYEEMIDDCVAYTEKEETHVAGPFVYGMRVKKGSNSGKIADACKRSPDRMQLESPKEFRRFASKESVDEFNEKFVFEHELRPWQIELEKVINETADDRTIIWVYGEKGNEGKSTYAKKMCKEGWYYTRGGKSENVLFDWAAHHRKNVVFDIPRSQKEFINYGLLENLKDGMVLSTKYEPLQIRRVDHIHLVVMANFMPVIGVELSEDRVKIIDCAELKKKYESIGLVQRPKKLKVSLAARDVGPKVKKLGFTEYMGITVDQDLHVRDLPNGSYVCYEDDEFEYVMCNRGNGFKLTRVWKPTGSNNYV